MTVSHRNLTGADLHEPKGISTAVTGAVYASNGSGSGSWIVPAPVDLSGIITPVGSFVFYAGSTAPTGWFLCYGQAISRSIYSDLFTAIGTTYGAGNGSTTFNLPDCRGRTLAGEDDMGGVSANRLTSPLDGDVLGATGGVQEHTITTGEAPVLSGSTSSAGSHSHSLNNGSNVYRNTGSGLSGNGIFMSVTANITVASGGAHTHTATVNEAGGAGLPHRNVQPSVILNTIMYHGVF